MTKSRLFRDTVCDNLQLQSAQITCVRADSQRTTESCSSLMRPHPHWSSQIHDNFMWAASSMREITNINWTLEKLNSATNILENTLKIYP